jgi:hypothetical protein
MDAVFIDVVASTILPIGHAWMTAFVGIIAFGVAGLSATTFLPNRQTSTMAAPLAGIPLWALATLAFYVATPPHFDLRFDSAAVIALAALALLSFWLAWLKGIVLGVVWRPLAVAAIFCLVVAPVTMMASIDRGGPAFLNGTDIVYPHLADWIRSHSPQMLKDGGGVVGPAVADPMQPYSAWPHLMLTVSTRWGAPAYLALVAFLSGQSGASFDGDAAAAIALVAACLGCAAVFSRSWRWLLCLGAALLTCLWYEYGRSNFMPKMLSYPLVLFTFGFVVSIYRSRVGPAEVFLLTILVSGMALMHSGQAYAALFICLAVPLLLASAAFEQRPPSLEDLSLAALPPAVAVIATGVMARPFNETWFPDFKLPWEKIVYLVTDLNYFMPEVAWLSGPALFVMLLVCVAGWVALVLIAVANRNAAAIALLCGPAVVVLGLYVLNMGASAVQFAGFPYPAVLCAAVMLAQQHEQREKPAVSLRHVVVTGTFVALIVVHIPRLIGNVAFFTVDADPRQIVAASDFDRLQAAIGDQQVYVDIRNNPRSINPVMVELGRRNVKLMWSPESWFTAASFRGWPPPSIEKIPDLRLIDATEHEGTNQRIIVETRRFKLVGPIKAPVSQNRD